MLSVCANNNTSYYLGDLPGTIQYKKDPKNIISAVNELQYDDLESEGYIYTSHSIENLNRMVPHTQKDKNWKIILIMKSTTNEERWMKAALLNKDTGKIALLTSTNKKENIISRGNRAIQSCDSNWFVGHYRMIAPILFWVELKNRLDS